MSVNTLGRSENLGRYWSGSELLLGDGVDLKIFDIKSDTVDGLESVEGYPFQNQVRIKGKFKYRMPSYDDSEAFSPEGRFEHRQSSGLFIIDTDQTKPNHRKVISEINDWVPSDAEIDDGISVSRDRVWDLLTNAESVDPLIVQDPNGRYDLQDLLRVLRNSGDDLHTTLREMYDQGEVSNYDVLDDVLDKYDSSSEIRSARDLDIDLYRTRIIEADAEFEVEGEFVTITYKQGSITIEPMSDKAREYALQLIERYLLS
ncbi:hypothetical protein [Halorubrum sp. F4]|uniref:hypothetical protein n=1 Tax=Halorubrum sp. F4 TaxID=2989715 RepID=UPI00247FB0C4|nr:hypothetical protein [Halorubrum sp. F4]